MNVNRDLIIHMNVEMEASGAGKRAAVCVSIAILAGGPVGLATTPG